MIGEYLKGWVDKSRKKGIDVDCRRWRQNLLDEATRQMAKVRGVGVDGWCDEQGDEACCEEMETWPEEFWEDPHALGWLHEQYAARARAKSFEEHVQREAKHSSMTATTQLYTPRWVADVLARGAMNAVEEECVEVLDPAVGGGQMLLAALEVIREEMPDAGAVKWVARLWGFDLDEDVVEVARRTIALEVARTTGARRQAAEAVVAEQIFYGDALSEVPGEEGRTWSVVLTNPPYMGWRSMPAELKERLEPRFRPFHSDLSAVFIARCHELSHGAVGILAQQAIWYLRRFEKARAELLVRGGLRYFLHLGSGAFWNLSGEKASVVAFVQMSGGEKKEGGSATAVWDLRGVSGPQEKRRAFAESLDVSEQEGGRKNSVLSRFNVAETAGVAGRPFCHDLPGELLGLFATRPPFSEWAEIPGSQNKTGRNREFVRSWNEVNPEELRAVEALGGRGQSDGEWVFYSKGGRFAPWWGNWTWVVDWSKKGRRFYEENRTSNLLSEHYWFREGIVYTDFGGARFNARWMPPGCLFDMTGPAIFPRAELWPELTERERIGAVLGVLNSSAARRMLRALNPTLHFQVRDVRGLPTPAMEAKEARSVAAMVWEIVDGVRELAGGVQGDPLYEEGTAVDEEEREAKIGELRALEEEVDARVCASYGVDRYPIEGASIREHHML